MFLDILEKFRILTNQADCQQLKFYFSMISIKKILLLLKNVFILRVQKLQEYVFHGCVKLVSHNIKHTDGLLEESCPWIMPQNSMVYY